MALTLRTLSDGMAVEEEPTPGHGAVLPRGQIPRWHVRLYSRKGFRGAADRRALLNAAGRFL
jgi:hypothetical protein